MLYVTRVACQTLLYKSHGQNGVARLADVAAVSTIASGSQHKTIKAMSHRSSGPTVSVMVQSPFGCFASHPRTSASILVSAARCSTMCASRSRKCPGLMSIRPDRSCLTESGRTLSTVARAARQSPPGFMVRPTSSRRSAAVLGFFGPLWFGSAGIDHLQFRGLADGAFGLRLGLGFQVNLIRGRPAPSRAPPWEGRKALRHGSPAD